MKLRVKRVDGTLAEYPLAPDLYPAHEIHQSVTRFHFALTNDEALEFTTADRRNLSLPTNELLAVMVLHD